jgi:SAM-dependent methyltransferase
MKPEDTGRLYDRIAAWWDVQQLQSTSGVHFLRKALAHCASNGKALDVGCGSGGRMITTLLEAGFQVTGIDVSESMIEYVQKRHPSSHFTRGDICEWQAVDIYDAIVAWDSIFHVPYPAQHRVVGKLCDAVPQIAVARGQSFSSVSRHGEIHSAGFVAFGIRCWGLFVESPNPDKPESKKPHVKAPPPRFIIAYGSGAGKAAKITQRKTI